MDWAREHPLVTASSAFLTLAFLYLWTLNRALSVTPPEVLAVTPHRWTEEEMDETYERIKQHPIDWAQSLPPKLDRRYIVTGGSGGVGGEIILQLLKRGQPPESIRNIDFRAPNRTDMQSGPVTRVDFAQADITSVESINAAFSKPWPKSVANQPLTVFHTAAVIIFNERNIATYDRVKRVNVDGAQNVVEAAKAAGADVFVSTSSASVALYPVEYWGNPFHRWPKHYWQAIDESDFDQPLKPHSQFFGNYAHSKAVSERLVCDANSPDFRTGVIRPANGIYGSSKGDQVVGLCLRTEFFPTWTPNICQNFVHAGHVSMGHLLFEAALLRGGTKGHQTLPQCAGRPFNIADPCAPILFEDFYRLAERKAETPIKIAYLQPVLILLLSYLIEFFDMVSRTVPGMAFLKPSGQLALLQPPIFTASTHIPASDRAAQRSVEEGGLGYRGICTTLEGVCQQIYEWNVEHEVAVGNGHVQHNGNGKTKGIMDGNRFNGKANGVLEMKNVGIMPATVKA